MYVPLAVRLLLVALVALGCVPDDWVGQMLRDAGRDAAVGACPAGDAAVAADTGACPAGQRACGGACVAGPSTLYRADDNTDDSAGRYNATAPRRISYAPGRFGQAFDFRGNGAAQFVALPSDVGDYSGDFTITLWFNTRGNGNILAKRHACAPGNPFRGVDIRLHADGYLGVELWTSGQFYQLDSTQRLDDGQWHQVAVVHDRGVASLNIDGCFEAMRSRGSNSINPPSSGVTYVGVGPCVSGAPVSDGTTDGTNWFSGLIDEIGFYPRALSSGELAALARGLCAS